MPTRSVSGRPRTYLVTPSFSSLSLPLQTVRRDLLFFCGNISAPVSPEVVKRHGFHADRQRSGRRRPRGFLVCDAGLRSASSRTPVLVYTHLTPPDRAGSTRNHSGKNPLKLRRGRPLVAAAGRMPAWISIGTLSWHAAQYAPCERVSRRPRTPRRSLITVSAIVGPPHRVHSIAMSRLRLSFSTANIKRTNEQIKNNH
jgi:hypothetical protein